MAAARPALYREVLTPALHRRFTGSALLVLVFCYVEAILIAEKSSFIWTWFPLGPTGIRALLLFISALSIFVLRVASLHLGANASPSPFTGFFHHLSRFNTLQTLGWYLFSAWWFSEVYVWSAPTSSDLGWITQGKSWERKKLNERPIYLRSVFFMFAVAQTILHLYYDYDQVALPVKHTMEEPISPQPQGLPTWFSTRVDILAPMFKWDFDNPANSILQNTVLRTLVISLSAPFLYSIFIRRMAWEWSFVFASLLWDVPVSPLSFIPPHYPSLVYRSFSAGNLLFFLWQSSIALFNAYVARQPIKKEQPLSSESKDSNGTLLNGLKSKKETPKTFAFWELSLITYNKPERRKAIFTDIDRSSGSAWTQIATACLSNITDVTKRIQNFLNPPSSSNSNQPAGQQPAAAIGTLPRISTPLRKENILCNPSPPAGSLEKIESNIGTLAKSYGQSPSPGTLKVPYSPQAKSLLTSSGEKLLSSPQARKLLPPNQQEKLSASGLRGLLNQYTMHFLRSRLGHPFRQTFSRRICTVVLGTPYSNVNLILTSIKSLTTLAVASLKEDPYGRVSKDVPIIIRTFTSTIQSIEAFVKNIPPHWTDVEFEEADRKVEDVEVVVMCLKSGLRDLIQAFGQYADELGLKAEELKAAQEIAGGVEDKI